MKNILALLLVFGSLFSQSQEILTRERASRYAGMALSCINREYPNKPGEVVGSINDIKPVREYRPAFYGCFDWHSAVHGHWMLVKLLKKYPGMEEAPKIIEAIHQNITPDNIQVEVRFFLDSNNKTFERTYGWAWLLKLAAELHTWEHPAGRQWEQALQPLTDLIVQYYLEFLPKLVYPIRVGEHTNTAFGMSFALDYARITQNKALETMISARAREFYIKDKNCPVSWEPSGFDFLSPCLAEAELMARVLTEQEFSVWIREFLPADHAGGINIPVEPAVVSDRKDGKLVHLDGLNFSRAWAYCIIAAKTKNEQKQILANAAHIHLNHSLPHIDDGNYEGGHWLASFAVYAMDEIDKLQELSGAFENK